MKKFSPRAIAVLTTLAALLATAGAYSRTMW